MNCLTKTVTIAFILLIASSSLTLQTVKPVTAQATVTPSVPEFTLKAVGNTIEITIKNQQFTPSNKSSFLYYNISYKGHYENEWLYTKIYCTYFDAESPPELLFWQSTSDYTVIEIPAPTKGEIDVRVRAQTGLTWAEDMLARIFQTVSISFEGEVSDWSSPQSVSTVIDGATGVPTSVEPDPDPIQTTTPIPQYTQNPTANSNQLANQFTALINSHWEKLALLALAAIIVVLAAGLVVLWRKVGNLADQKRPQENSP